MNTEEISKLFSLEGKKAIVIGGAGGIGTAIAKGLAIYGADTAIASRNLEKLKETAAEIEAETGKKIRTYQVDVTSEKSIQELVEATKADVGITDILVNSMGANKKFKAEEMPMDEWDKMYAVNVRGLFICCKEFGKGMIEQNYGKIINVGSIGGKRTSKSGISSCYSSSKGAVDTLTLTLAAGWGKYNITVNNINPILTATPMMVEIMKQDPAKEKSIKERSPMGRMGTPEDAIGMAIFFASDASGFVTGQFLYPDGGLMTLQ